jgi:1-acyl-sn-glycerol-3-phosphate acyltransferase
VKAKNLLVVILIVLAVLCLTIPLLLSMAVGFRRPWLGVGTGAVRICVRILGIEVEIRGRENLEPGRTIIYMPNHTSMLDGPLVVSYLRRRVRVIIKKEAFRLPVVGIGMKFIGFVPVDRRGGETGKRVIEKAVATIKASGDAFVIFPEGTRSPDGRLQRFRRGGFFLAAESGSPIVPVAVLGTRALMPKGSWWIRPGRVRITFLPAVPAAGETAESLPGLMERVREPIARTLAEEFP